MALGFSYHNSSVSIVVVGVVVVNFHVLVFFSITAGQISTKLGTKHPWVKILLKFVQMKDHVFFQKGDDNKRWNILTKFKEGPRPFPRGDNTEIAKSH